MAAAVRLIATEIHDDVRVAAAGRGRFGERVVELLSAGRPRSEATRPATLEDLFDQRPDAVVIADSLLDPVLLHRATALSRERGIPWLPVYVDHPLVSIGPFPRAGQAPCFACSYRRRVQHAPNRATMLALHAAYSENPDSGPKGFLPHHARFAAAVAAGLLWPRQGGGSAACTGEVTVIHVVRNLPATHRLIAFPDCEHCGDPAPQPTSATLLNLVRQTQETYPENPGTPEEVM